MATQRTESTAPEPPPDLGAEAEETLPVKERKGDRNESQTVLRVCDVLKTFRSLGESLQLSEVIERTGLPKTTVFRLIRTLIHGGLLERAGSGIYRNRFGPVSAHPSASALLPRATPSSPAR